MIVYMATDMANGKRYIGATSMPLKRRIGMHQRTAIKSKYAFHAALRNRYDEFAWAKLAEFDDDNELRDLAEQEAIAKYKTHISENGYNMTRGGVGMFGDSMPDEARRRANAKRLGAKRTPEMRARMAAASTSRKIPIDALDAIMSMRSTGMSFGAIGLTYGVSESTIRQYIRRRKS